MKNNLSKIFIDMIIPALWATTYMVFFSSLLSITIGFLVGIILAVTDKNGLSPNKYIYTILGTIINILRSFPFLILLITIIPLTRFIVGTSIGKTAAIVPLTLGTAPFIGRLIETTLKEVDLGLIEAAQSFGASNIQIIVKVMIKEAIPSLISNITMAIISILGSTAIAGTVGAGGLGAVALSYGYQNFNDKVMYSIVLVLIILVQGIQFLGNRMYEKLK